MSGYDYDEWKSNNAVQAEWEGKHPMSHWTKDLLIESIENEFRSKPEIIELCKKQTLAVLRKAMLCYSEWHHTSSAYNETDYFELVGGSIEDIKGYIEEAKAELAKEKEATKGKKRKIFKNIVATYEESSKTTIYRRGRSKIGYEWETFSEREGYIDGRYFYDKFNNKKKDITGRHFEIVGIKKKYRDHIWTAPIKPELRSAIYDNMDLKK